MAVKQLSDKNTDGTVMGQSTTDKLGFYGLSTAIVQPSLSTFSGLSTGVSVAITNAALIELMTKLRALGLLG